jgi:post-segregation antitoxin (ccd killing protein)
MQTLRAKQIKKTISIPAELFEQTHFISDNFSYLVTIALQEYLRYLKIEAAMASFGKWQERKEDSATLVRKLRKDKGPRYARHTS